MKRTIPQTPTAWILLLARIALGAVFIYASWDKILDPVTFAESIANYQILPETWINVTALLLPWVELICGLGLITGALVRGSALIVTSLLLVFTGALAYSAYRGLDIHCGCFTAGSGMPDNLYLDLFRDLVLLTLAVWVLIGPGRMQHARKTAGDH